MDVVFLKKYSQLLVAYCLEFKPVSVTTKKIVFSVPTECAELKPFLLSEIKAQGFSGIDKDELFEKILEPVIYISVVGDNVIGALYSHEMLKPQYYKKAHILLSPFPTQKRAEAAGMTLSSYTTEFTKLLFLDHSHPLLAWREQLAKVTQLKNQLNSLALEKIEVMSDSSQFSFTLSRKRKWLGASGRNLPSSEVFTSPDWQSVQGKVRFNIPINKYGYSIKNINCVIENGMITSYSCDNDKEQLDLILAQRNMLKVGEFSLTDKKLSTITKYMASSILDENLGGEFGNMHLALGKSYATAYPDYLETLSDEELDQIGFNNSTDHIDFMNTEAKEVYAWNTERGKFLLYKDGEFQF